MWDCAAAACFAANVVTHFTSYITRFLCERKKKQPCLAIFPAFCFSGRQRIGFGNSFGSTCYVAMAQQHRSLIWGGELPVSAGERKHTDTHTHTLTPLNYCFRLQSFPLDAIIYTGCRPGLRAARHALHRNLCLHSTGSCIKRTEVCVLSVMAWTMHRSN